MPDQVKTGITAHYGVLRPARCLFLPDGIYDTDSILARLGAHAVNLLHRREQQRFLAATEDAIVELCMVIRQQPKSHIVVYGTKRKLLAARLLASCHTERHIKVVLCDRELNCDLLPASRSRIYQIDTDRYPFTDRH
jgi:hypothetical protein